MKDSLSIIIAHYLPSQNVFENPLKKTISIIEKENTNHNIEIIIADDGSNYSKELTSSFTEEVKDKNIYILKDLKLKSFLDKIQIKSKLIKKWVNLPKKVQRMSKARVVNYGTKLAKNDKFLFLDDDNYFISYNSIDNLLKLFL